MTAAQLRRAIEQLIESQPDDRRLRDHLEGLSNDPLFPSLSWFWGPRLYARSRAIFRPFIVRHLSDQIIDDNRWLRIHWDEHARDLDAWLQSARAARDVALVRRLLRWKYGRPDRWGLDEPRFCAALADAYAAAPTPAARAIVLDEHDGWFGLDEPTALRLYQTDRGATKFILAHLPRGFAFFGRDDKRVMWDRLADTAQARGDEVFQLALYRALVSIDRWRADVMALAASERDPERLNAALLDHHPTGYRKDVSGTVIDLVEHRGRDVLPYLRAKLDQVVGGYGKDNQAKRLIGLAAKRGWWDLWTSAVRAGPEKLYGDSVAQVLDDRALSDAVKRERLRALAGVSSEWNWPGVGLARIHSLGDEVASALYQAYPDLVRGPFRAQVTPRWWSKGYARLVALAQQAGDAELLDLLAARYATHVSWRKVWGERHGQGASNTPDPLADTASALARYYQAIRDSDEDAFARRAANVLTRIPAYAVRNYHAVLRHNDLARLLFTRSLKSFLVAPAAVQDLVEASDIHVMMLAYRVLALPDPRAVALASANLEILLGTLLRPLHRKTRLAAFDALVNAARATPEAAALVHARAREALRLPDKKYPKAELVGLIARLLGLSPALAGPREVPVVYRHAATTRSAA